MPRTWNDDGLKRQFDRIKEDAKRDGFTNEELEHPYLDKLSHMTKSHRIYRMIKLAYWLGWMRGIDHVDQGKTPISIRTPIETIPTHFARITRSPEALAAFILSAPNTDFRNCANCLCRETCKIDRDNTGDCDDEVLKWLNQPATGGEAGVSECCQTCEYWLEKYQECEHPDQFARDSGAYNAPPDKWCELYEPNV